MDPKHLLYLSVVLEKGSLTEAAKHLAVTQPTLTRIMATLEMQAGTTLFSRSRYGVKGTDMGEALAREGRAIQQNVEIAQATASRYRIGMNREINIGIGPLLAATVMPSVMDKLMRDHPRQSLSISVFSPTTLIDQLMDRKLDFLIAPAPAERLLSGTTRKLIAEDTLGIYAGREHPLAKKQNLKIEDFAGADWVSLGHSNPFERQVMELLTAGGISKIRTQLVFRNDGVMLVDLLARSHHLAVLPDLPMRAVNQPERFTRLDFNAEQTTNRNLYFWVRDEFEDQTFEDDFFNTVKRHFSQLTG